MTGHACPECGRRTAGEPGTEHRVPCRCGTDTGATPLTGDELRAARSAEMAAAEDFDPLRIRPYVTLGDGAAPGGGDAGADAGGPARETADDAAATMPLHLGGGPGAGSGPESGPGPVDGSGADSRTGVGAGAGSGTGAGDGSRTHVGAGADSRTGVGAAPSSAVGAPPAADESRRRTAAQGA
ncbi:hypothetical protein GA0115243_103892, partial [Streptomyces sp. ScaeMP-e83]